MPHQGFGPDQPDAAFEHGELVPCHAGGMPYLV